MNTARLLVPIFTLQDFLYLLLDFLLAGSYSPSPLSIYFSKKVEKSTAAEEIKEIKAGVEE